MSDPTLYVTTITFWSALGMCAIGAGIQQWAKPTKPAITEIAEASSESPPPLPWQEETEREKVPTRFYGPYDLIGLLFVFLLFFALTAMNIQASAKKDLVMTPMGLLISIGFQFMIAGGVMATVISRIHPADWLGLKWKKWPWVFLIAPVTVVSLWIMMAALQGSGYMKWIESLGVDPVQEVVKLLQQSNDPLVISLMAIAAVIVAPLCEELVFRGYLYPLAKKYAGPWIGGLFSAVIFGCAHGNLAALLPLTIFGILMVIIYQKTGSLWATIAVHFCFNGAAVAIQILDRYYHFLPENSL